MKRYIDLNCCRLSIISYFSKIDPTLESRIHLDSDLSHLYLRLKQFCTQVNHAPHDSICECLEAHTANCSVNSTYAALTAGLSDVLRELDPVQESVPTARFENLQRSLQYYAAAVGAASSAIERRVSKCHAYYGSIPCSQGISLVRVVLPGSLRQCPKSTDEDGQTSLCHVSAIPQLQTFLSRFFGGQQPAVKGYHSLEEQPNQYEDVAAASEIAEDIRRKLERKKKAALRGDATLWCYRHALYWFSVVSAVSPMPKLPGDILS
jgi:hypothetical protein